MIFEDSIFSGLVDAFFLYRRRPVEDGCGHWGHHAIDSIDEASAYGKVMYSSKVTNCTVVKCVVDR